MKPIQTTSNSFICPATSLIHILFFLLFTTYCSGCATISMWDKTEYHRVPGATGEVNNTYLHLTENNLAEICLSYSLPETHQNSDLNLKVSAEVCCSQKKSEYKFNSSTDKFITPTENIFFSLTTLEKLNEEKPKKIFNIYVAIDDKDKAIDNVDIINKLKKLGFTEEYPIMLKLLEGNSEISRIIKNKKIFKLPIFKEKITQDSRCNNTKSDNNPSPNGKSKIQFIEEKEKHNPPIPIKILASPFTIIFDTIALPVQLYFYKDFKG
jgi:uncharacterized protein YceK